MTPVRDQYYFRYLRRRAQTARTQAVGTQPKCIVLPFVRDYPHRVGVGGIFQLLDDRGDFRAHRR